MTEKHPKKIVTLTCSCCGSMTRGRQWYNRDSGYGLCNKCAKWILTRESPESMESCYGRDGEHYFTVKHWTSRNDPNHTNKHAEYMGIEFFAFPYQPYMSDHIGKYNAFVSSSPRYDRDAPNHEAFYSNIYIATGGGRSEKVDHGEFYTRDEAIIWTAERLLDLGGQS